MGPISLEIQLDTRSPVNRTQEQLKLKFKNIKAGSRKHVNQEKLERFKTGGGFAAMLAPTVDDRLAALGEIVQPLHNPFDTDAAYEIANEEIEFEHMYITFVYFTEYCR